MNASLHDYQRSMMQRDHVQSIMFLDNQDKWGSLLHGVDLLYIVIINRPQPHWEIKQLLHAELLIEEHLISQWQLEQWIKNGTNERILKWVIQAEIIYDQNEYVNHLQRRIERSSAHLQKWKICEEYSHFLRHYLTAKSLLKQNLIPDAYQAVIAALHCWARIIVCKAGVLSKESIWKQVKYIEPSVYKLYEELVSGQEPLEKRIELQLLPIELSVMSKMKECTQALVNVIQSKHRPWSLEQLRNHPELSGIQIDLHLLLRKMAHRSIIQQVILQHEEPEVMEIGYVAVE